MTWNALTFTSSHILTASDMNRIQDNFTALAQGHSGAPAIGVNSFMVTGVASVATLNISSEALIGGSQIQFKNEKAQADGYAGLDADGRVPTGQAGVPTGAVLPYVATTAPTGWLLCDGDTIGDVASGADHEDAGYEDLFNLLKDMTPNAGTEVWATIGPWSYFSSTMWIVQPENRDPDSRTARCTFSPYIPTPPNEGRRAGWMLSTRWV